MGASHGHMRSEHRAVPLIVTMQQSSTRRCLVSRAFLSLLSLLFVIPALAGEDPRGVAPPAPPPPRHELCLTLEEFSVLHSAAEAGIRKYGGVIDFKVRMAAGKDGPTWTIGIPEPSLLAVWSVWVFERTAELVNVTDLERPDEQSLAMFRTVKSLNAKLLDARGKPIWEETTLSGPIVERNGQFVVQDDTGTRMLFGEQANALKGLVGSSAGITGYEKAQGTFEVLRFTRLKGNTLELFVMSQCPYGRKAEVGLIKRLRALVAKPSLADTAPPKITVRYILRKTAKDGDASFISMHGDSEVAEDLVQIAIRDNFAEDTFFNYLLARAESDAPWEELARHSGLNPEAITFVKETIAKHSRAMLDQEFAYVAGSCGITDKSPTLIWEGRTIPDLNRITPLAGIDWSEGSCDSSKH